MTTKAAILAKSQQDWPDADFFFAQVAVEEKWGDFKPACGNILSAFGLTAIEMGLAVPTGDLTEIKIAAVNTGACVVANVQTQNSRPNYEGVAEIAGGFPADQLRLRCVSWMLLA